MEFYEEFFIYKFLHIVMFVFVDGCIYALKKSKKPIAGSVNE